MGELDHAAIYRQQPEAYHQLVSHEDADGQLESALLNLLPAAGGHVLDVGTGTGRVAGLLSGRAGRVVGCDRSLPMLRTAAKWTASPSQGRPAWVAAENAHLPIRAGWADLVVAGWSLGHSVEWFGADWPQAIGGALAEMARAARPGGRLAIIETLGTGARRPNPPTAGLAEYYTWLESEHGFTRQWFRTDYLFDTAQQAHDLIEFFFGADLALAVASHGERRVPECTGLWTRPSG